MPAHGHHSARTPLRRVRREGTSRMEQAGAPDTAPLSQKTRRRVRREITHTRTVKDRLDVYIIFTPQNFRIYSHCGGSREAGARPKRRYKAGASGVMSGCATVTIGKYFDMGKKVLCPERGPFQKRAHTVTFESRWRDLNPRPADYESAAIPLSHSGNCLRALHVRN